MEHVTMCILLSQIWDFPLRLLLRLAGSRWRYSTPPPHGSHSLPRILSESRYIASAPTAQGTKPLLLKRVWVTVAALTAANSLLHCLLPSNEQWTLVLLLLPAFRGISGLTVLVLGKYATVCKRVGHFYYNSDFSKYIFFKIHQVFAMLIIQTGIEKNKTNTALKTQILIAKLIYKNRLLNCIVINSIFNLASMFK
jgi:hypothetical protein